MTRFIPFAMLAVAFTLSGTLQAQPVKRPRILPALNVVATGNSHTVSYTSLNRFQRALDARWPGRFTSQSLAISGTDSPEYAGLLENPQCACTMDMAGEVLDLRPDVIVWMIGTNDAWHDARGREYFDQYTANVPTFLNRFVASGATVIVANPPPVLPLEGDPDNADIDRWLLDSYQPYLEQLTGDLGLPLVDLRAAILSQPDYETTMFRQTNPDGIHLSTEGYDFIAGKIADAVNRHAPLFRRRFSKRRFVTMSTGHATPEPSSLLLIVAAILLRSAGRFPGRSVSAYSLDGERS